MHVMYGVIVVDTFLVTRRMPTQIRIKIPHNFTISQFQIVWLLLLLLLLLFQ